MAAFHTTTGCLITTIWTTASVLLMMIMIPSVSSLALKQQLVSSSNVPMVVVFGRPGSGKTTIAEAAHHDWQQQHKHCISTSIVHMDLDVCVPQWMRDNFSQGIYPNVSERGEFAKIACDHVDQELQRAYADTIAAEDSSMNKNDDAIGVDKMIMVILSFSFVNTDLRDYFRQRFPRAVWALVDTTEEEAALRIQQREGHFYKGKVEASSVTKEAKRTTSRPNSAAATKSNSRNRVPADNADWSFAPVNYPHAILDGTTSVASNASRIIKLLSSSDG